ncbi:MAG: amidohydrolase family protein [Acidobacteriota bacterium]
MRKFLVMLALLAVLAFPLIRPSQELAISGSLVINHVTVIDLTGSPAQKDMTVVVSGGRINEIFPTPDNRFSENARVIDGTGKFLIPGLWDMHVHVLQKRRLPHTAARFLTNGVTGFRDMGSPPDELAEIPVWRQAIRDGSLLAPRFVAAGAILDGSPAMFPHLSIGVKDASEARRAIADLRDYKIDFIKVYTLLSRDAYFAIADETQKNNLPFAGHVPDSVSAVEASDAGQRSIEHLSGVLLACSTDEDDLRRRLLEARRAGDAALLHDALERILTRGAQTYSQAKAENLFAHFAKNQTWQTPTLVGLWNPELANRKKPRQPDDLQFNKTPAWFKTQPLFQGQSLLQAQSLWLDGCCLNASAENIFSFAGNDKVPEIMQAMHRAGVRFLAGTDAPNLWAQPGASLHRELELFVELGLTPMEALQTATRNPAIYLGLSDSLGTIEQGKIADLVLLDENPLDDIRNTRKIAAVMVNGQFFTRAELLARLAENEANSLAN